MYEFLTYIMIQKFNAETRTAVLRASQIPVLSVFAICSENSACGRDSALSTLHCQLFFMHQKF
jgi:hypothetical protein